MRYIKLVLYYTGCISVNEPNIIFYAVKGLKLMPMNRPNCVCARACVLLCVTVCDCMSVCEWVMCGWSTLWAHFLIYLEENVLAGRRHLYYTEPLCHVIS